MNLMLLRLQKRLDKELQLKWEYYFPELIDQILELKFADLLKYVEVLVTVMSTEYGRVAEEAGG